MGMTREQLKARYRSNNLTGALNNMFDEVVDYVIDNRLEPIDKIKEHFHTDSQPGIMNAMFDEIVDFILENYDTCKELKEAKNV